LNCFGTDEIPGTTSLSKLVMSLSFSQRFKGAVPGYQGKEYADRWGLSDDLGKVVQR